MNDHDTSDHTRRAALRMGVAVAWVAPAMTVLGASSAHADIASGGGVVPPPTTSPPRPTNTATAPGPGVAPAVTISPTPGQVAPTATQTSRPVGSPAPAVRAARADLPELAKTGSEVAPLGAAGVALIAGGAAVFAASRGTHRDDADRADA